MSSTVVDGLACWNAASWAWSSLVRSGLVITSTTLSLPAWASPPPNKPASNRGPYNAIFRMIVSFL